LEIRSISFYTFGCKVNQYETEKLKSLALKEGWEVKPFGNKTDYVFINSCAVTHIAERKARRLIRFIRAKFPEAKIILAGCYPERLKSYNFPLDVDILLDNKEKWEFFNGDENSFVAPIPTERTRALVKVQDGCNNFCSYCIVPFLRGRERSKPVEVVLWEVENLLNSGYKEIVLTGVRLGAYGKDLGGNINLANLIRKILDYPELKRLRLSSIEPMDFSPDLLDVITEEKVCKHLHIPLQSGDDEVLRRMGRRYDTKYFYGLIENIRKRVPDIAIATDIIVGFPGEEEDNFKNTLEFAKEIGFMKIHVFPFSPRPGTKAYTEKPLPPQIVEERKRILMSLSDELWKKYVEKFIGSRMEVLVENIENGIAEGLTSNYIRVFFKDEKVEKGEFVPVILKNIDKERVLGERVKECLILNSQL